MDSLKVAAISLTATENKASNLEAAFSMVQQAAEQGADWVQLPECFAYHGSYDHSYDAAEEEGGQLYAALSNLAKEHSIVLFAGTMGERPATDMSPSFLTNELGQRRVYNTAYVFDRDGKEIAKYRKTHLFNLEAQSGAVRYCEADGFIAGDSSCVFVVDGWRVGLTVCYDLRFPELFAKLMHTGACDILAVPSAFTSATGKAHWQLLLRARAVEWQAYVIAANQCGQHAPGKSSYGHSLICDPWGEILSMTADQPGIAIATINKKRLQECRNRLPALKNRRPELYR